MASPYTTAFCEIPELEFEMGASHKRRVDSVYNHICAAIFNLERHVEMIGHDSDQAQRERQGIMDACDTLRKVLDMDTPATLVVVDPGGLSAFKPGEGVKVTELEADAGAYDRSARALAIEAEMEKEMGGIDLDGPD